MTEPTARQNGPAPAARDAARRWIVNHFLEHGPELPSRDVMDAAALAGHSLATLKRAFRELVDSGLAQSVRRPYDGRTDARNTVWRIAADDIGALSRAAAPAQPAVPVIEAGPVPVARGNQPPDHPYRSPAPGTSRWNL